jgi:DoxX-like family
MKKDKIIFWVSTGLIALMMLFSAFNYFTNPEMKAAFTHLGFPDYFREELGIAKILGALALVIPMIPYTVKQFAYFGFALVFISAAYAHLSSGDPFSMAIAPLVFLGILIISYIYAQKLQNIKA